MSFYLGKDSSSVSLLHITIDAAGTTPQIKFNGVVEFSNVTSTATHKSSTSSPILGATTDVEVHAIILLLNLGYIVSNGKWINNSSVTDTSCLALKDMSNVTTIDGGKITTGSITAAQIQANSISADRLSTTSLSAISANLGTITSGVIYDSTWNGSTYKMKINLTNGSIYIR